MSLAVVKVGGSLYDLPDLGERLQSWLQTLQAQSILLVPGGGQLAEAVRQLDRWHGFGEEMGHELALRTLSITARFLAELLPGYRVTDGEVSTQKGGWILDAHAFNEKDKEKPGCLPECWEATSDSVAARVAVVTGARELVLLKSVTIPEPLDWDLAARQGWVDSVLPTILRSSQDRAPQQVRVVNLREWSGWICRPTEVVGQEESQSPGQR